VYVTKKTSGNENRDSAGQGARCCLKLGGLEVFFPSRTSYINVSRVLVYKVGVL